MPITKPRLSTNINTDVGTFTDPILVLHQGSTQADVDVGFLMNRSNGLTSNAAVIWQESSKSFVHILTNSSGAADANLTVQSYANVSVGNVLLINNAGIYVNGTLGTSGQVLASDGTKTFWAPPGGFTGGAVPNQTTFASNLVVSNTTQSTSNVTGALVVAGGIGVAGNIYSGANIVITNGIFWGANGLAYSSASSVNPFTADSSLGTTGEPVTSIFDLGLTTDSVLTESYDLGGLFSNSVVYGQSIVAGTIDGSKLVKDIYLTGSTIYFDNISLNANTSGTALRINGVDIATVDNYDLDDISGYTDGITHVFPLTYNLANVNFTSPWQITVAVNGILQPAFNSSPNASIVWQSFVFPANKGYTLRSNSQIKFAEAPAARSDIYIRKQPGTTPAKIKILPFKPIDVMMGY